MGMAHLFIGLTLASAQAKMLEEDVNDAIHLYDLTPDTMKGVDTNNLHHTGVIRKRLSCKLKASVEEKSLPNVFACIDDEVPSIAHYLFDEVWVEYEDFGWRLVRSRVGKSEPPPTDQEMAYTVEEEKLLFVRAVSDMAKHTAKQYSDSSEACDALVHRILNLLDGTNAEFSGYELTVKPHPSDEVYNLNHNRRYHKETSLSSGEYLHELYHQLNTEELRKELKIKNSGTYGIPRGQMVTFPSINSETKSMLKMYLEGYKDALTGELKATCYPANCLRAKSGQDGDDQTLYFREIPNDFEFEQEDLRETVECQINKTFELGQKVFWDSEFHDERGIYRVTGDDGAYVYLERQGLHDVLTYKVERVAVFVTR